MVKVTYIYSNSTKKRSKSPMGFFEKLFENLAEAAEKAEREKNLEKILIPFDQNWVDAWHAIEKDQEANPHALDTSISFDIDLFDEIAAAISSHAPSERIPYSDEKFALNNVGESFRQEEIREFCHSLPGEDLGWIYGFLVPEMANEFDKHAVAVYVFRENANSMDRDSKYALVHAGYLDKDSAKKVHGKILRMITKDLFVPLLVRVHGGTQDKPSYGVFPYAMTNAIDFA